MRIVIKVGSNVLCGEKNQLDLDLIKQLVEQVKFLHQKKHQVILVTSGAVSCGKDILQKGQGLSKAAFAAVGQAGLMKHYYDLFSEYKIKIAQLLLSLNCFKNRARYEALKCTLAELVNDKVVPVINENDATTARDSFGDNDSLASMIAVLCGADKLLFFTDLDGLYSSDPKFNKGAKIIREVKNIDLEIQRMCSKKTSSFGSGGMLSKLKGAKLATTCGVEVYIINGLNPENIRKLLITDKSLGTKFLAQKSKISDRKKWLLIGAASKGRIIVDQGAREALENKNSLLAVGVRDVKGEFGKQDFVNLVDQRGEIFAFGISNYGSEDLAQLKNLKEKTQIKKKYPREVVHIDNLTLLK